MSLESLRAKFLSIAATEEKKFDVIVDRGLREAVEAADANLVSARARRDNLADDRKAALAALHEARHENGKRLERFDGSPKHAVTDANAEVVAIDAKLVEAEQAISDAGNALDAAKELAGPQTIVLVFGKMPPTELSNLERSFIPEGKQEPDYLLFHQAFMSKTYRRAEDASGADIGISWDEVLGGALTEGDLALVILPDVLQFNREITIHPH